MAHTHPRAKTTYMTNPKCLNVIHQNISLYILFHAILSYLNLTNPHKHICCEKKKRRMADTHLSIETTYITYPICYTMMLPNMPFRKADAHPLRLNTRCKDLTLAPSTFFLSLSQCLLPWSLDVCNWEIRLKVIWGLEHLETACFRAQKACYLGARTPWQDEFARVTRRHQASPGHQKSPGQDI